MATVTRMTEQEHKEIFQTISESIVAEPDIPPDPPNPEGKPPRPKKKEVDPRALRGALYLDEHHPGWAHKMKLKTFHISNAGECVVGQVVGPYWDNAHKLFPVTNGSDVKAYEFGIMPTDDNVEELNRSWKILIKERQVCAEANGTSA